MIRLLAVAALLVLLAGPCGDVVVAAMEVGYAAKESNTRLAVATAQSSAGGVEIVEAGTYEVLGEE